MPESFLPVIVGSFSTPAADNPTSAVVEASFRATGFFGRYVNCEVAPEMLGDAVRGARAQGWRGFNCSLPHKVSVLAYLDELTPEAAAIGAVNCVTLDPAGRMVGDNTDGRGFLRALRETVDPSGADVVVIGAGGAARAVCVELALAGASRMTVVNRSRDRALGVVAAVTACSAASAAYEPLTPGFEIPASADIVVNATSIGLAPADQEIPPVSLELLGSTSVVADLIPNPPTTRFLRAAADRGLRTIDGKGMLVNQAAINVEWWTGAPADLDAMRAVLDDVTR